MWNTVDFSMVKAYLQHKHIRTRNKWFKFMHDLQPLGRRKQLMSPSGKDDKIDLCPCCHHQLETQLHMITCEKNPKRADALRELTSGGSTFKEHHNFVSVLTECLEQWIQDSQCIPSINTFKAANPYSPSFLPPHMLEILTAAIKEQSYLGWAYIFRGYFSKQWHHLASSHMTNASSTATNPSDGRRRLSTILQRIQGFLETIWQGRNEVLHNHAKDDEAKFQSLESAVIRHCFNQPHLLPAQDQHYCAGSLLKLLRRSSSYRRRWLMRVRKARAALLSDQLRQAKITSYFLRPHSKDACSSETSHK